MMVSKYQLQKNPILRKYLLYCQHDNEITSRIRDHLLTPPFLLKAGTLLHVKRQSEGLILFNRMEENTLLSIAISDVIINQQTPLTLYQAKYSPKDTLSCEILEARQNSYASLFEITQINGVSIYIRDLLSPTNYLQRPFVDIALSQTARPFTVMFLDIMPLRDFYTRAGATFLFAPEDVLELQEDFVRHKRKIDSSEYFNPERVRRVAFFFQRNRKLGIRIIQRPLP